MSNDAVTFRLRGHLPTKKNNLRRSRNGRLFRAAVATDEMAPVQMQIQAQWKRRPPFERAIVDATFYLEPKRRGDGDGMLTTLLDLLKQAGVITDDNWRRVVRCGATCIPTVAGDERIEVRVESFDGRTE